MFDKMKQAGSLMKQMNSLKKKIDKLGLPWRLCQEFREN